MSNVNPKSGGRYSLYCSDCKSWVPNTANHEMHKEGFFAHSHTCYVDKDGVLRGRDSGGAVPDEGVEADSKEEVQKKQI